MTLDFKPPRQQNKLSPQKINWKHLSFSLVLIGIFLGGWFLFFDQEGTSPAEVQAFSGNAPEGSLPEPAVAKVVAPEIKRDILEGVIKSGDTITSLFADIFSPQEIYHLARKCENTYALSRIRAGNLYEIHLADGVFDKFVYDIDDQDQLIIKKGEDDFEVAREAIAYELKREVVQATILSSLFNALNEAGEKPELAISLADIFAWDIDFIRDIREGDSFKVLVEKRFREGEFAGYGPILAAEFDNNGEVFKAFLFEGKEAHPDYYDEEGKSVRKAFLKAPLSFSRISSGFSKSRFHPVLKRYKPHPAIDYAAPAGTPIHSVGNGIVTRKGYTKYNGRYIRVRHNSIYETHYNHMSRFAKGVNVGTRVNQGQTIGFVGSSGLATGPHLDFRMYKNGASVNPLKVKAPPAAPIPKELFAEFAKVKAAYAAHFVEEPSIRISSLQSNNKSVSGL